MKETNCGGSLAVVQNEYDIVGSLPSELVVHIVDYLDVADIARCQRVSKQWNSIFSSNTIVKFVLSRTLSALGLEPTNAAEANSKTYFRWLHSLQSARPVKRVFLRTEKPLMIECHSRRLFYVFDGIFNRKEVRMLDLETGKESVFLNNGRIVTAVCPSDRYLFVVSVKKFPMRADSRTSWMARRIIIAWDLQTSQKLGEKEFSWVPMHITVTEDKAVIVPWANERAHPIFVWDLGSNHVHEFGSFTDLWLWHVNAEQNVLVTFEINWDAHPPEVQQTDWTLLSGELIHQKHFHLSLGDRRIEEPLVVKQFQKQFHGRNHTYGFNAAGNPLIHLTYDRAVDQLSVRLINCIESRVGFHTFLASFLTYYWAKEPREVLVYNALSGTMNVRPYQLDIREVHLRSYFCTSSPYARSRRNDFNCCGDREVYCMAGADGMQLWFFNPDFLPDIPNAEPFLAMEESG